MNKRTTLLAGGIAALTLIATIPAQQAPKPLVVDAVAADLMRQKVSMVSWVSHLVIAPPLIITEEQLDECVAALDVALKIADEKVEG